MKFNRWTSGIGILAIVIASGSLGILAKSRFNNPEPVPATSVQTVQPEVKAPEDTLDGNELYNMINQYRQQNGIQPLTRVPQLDASAMEKCLDMQKHGYFDHVSPATGEAGYQIAARHYPGKSYWSENILIEASTSEAKALSQWQNSPSHNAAMLDRSYIYSGLAVCHDDPNWTRPGDAKYVVEHFAR